MLKLPDEEKSYWRAVSSHSPYPRLSESLEVDVAIVGGGICGLTTAYLLKQSGLSVAVLEKGTIGSGTTGQTTGKVTSQHNIVYEDLLERLGEKAARAYGEANQTAIDQIEDIIKREKIDCGWTRDDNYVYTTKPEQVKRFKSEAETAARLGLPATFTARTPLPFDTKAAVKFINQAKFNVLEYITGLARAVDGQGSYIFENSSATSIRDGEPGGVGTKDARVTAKNIVVATNVPTFPLIARGAYCMLEYPTTSYIVAIPMKKKFEGMYISPDEGSYSIFPVTFDKEQLLFVGGENHIPGLAKAEEKYQKLAAFAEEKFDAKEVRYKWRARDYLAYDGVPLVGKMYPWSKNLYVATAFKKWGLTNTMAAAMILRDTILGGSNPWAETFKALRLSPVGSIPRVAAKYLR
jgi:glycine/D-amino acid oxidase-like deaminating enzyme